MFSFFKSKKESSEEEVLNTRPPAEDFQNVEPLASYFQQLTGITFSKQKGILQSKLRVFCKNQGIYSFSECHLRVQREPFLKQALVNHLTTNESYFYRENRQLQEFSAQVLQHQQNNAVVRHKIDILCAPSATGEEAYSIVIALLESGLKNHEIRVLGIDINDDAVAHAKNGLYAERSISQLPAELTQRYFQKVGEKYQLAPEIQSAVHFQVINIFSPQFLGLGKFDYVFSRNMLIYFDAPTKLKAKTLLESCLKNPERKVFFGHADLF